MASESVRPYSCPICWHPYWISLKDKTTPVKMCMCIYDADRTLLNAIRAQRYLLSL